ncbi:hypothetical protein IMSAGC011_01881 [Lachnospiraceae bacterium]|nr:hypothetical protein IMSAGC011_01881 [Lachnospiraceae bacterium]
MKTYFSLKGILNSAGSADTQPLTPRDMLLDDIRKTQCALETAYSGFDNVTDPDLIDCYIYEVNSALKRYRFLLQQAERMQLYEESPLDSSDCYDSKSLVHQPIMNA